MTNKTLIWLLIATVVLSVGFSLLFGGTKTIQTIKEQMGAVTSPWSVGPEFSINELNTYVARADFKNATTTFVSFISPLPATSTIDLVELIQTGVATSTIVITCGPSYSQYGAPAIVLLTSDSVATSTNFGFIINNNSSSYGGGIGGGSVANVRIGPNQYFLCVAKDANGLASLPTGYDGVTGDSNTFAGNFKVRFVR